MSKKILIFSLSYYPLPVSGAEAAVNEITKRIDPEDITFHLICNGYNSELPKVEQHDHVLIHRIGITTKDPEVADLRKRPLHFNKYLYQFGAVFKAWRLHRKHKYDAIWCLMPHSAGVPAALFHMLFPKLKLVTTLQEGDPIEHIERSVKPLWPLFTRAFTKATVIQAISTYLEDWAYQRKATCPVELIRNGANPKNLENPYSEVELNEMRDALGKKESDVHLLIAARLVEQKAIDVIIKALKLLPEHIHLIIVGGGVEEENLKALTKELDLEGRVQFVGMVERDDVPKYRNTIVADIFVHPSRSEGLGLSLLSAMAARLPVITTQVGGIADFLFDSKRNPGREPTGWAVDPDNPEQIAAAVMDIIAHPAEAKRVTDNARAMVEKDYNWDVIARDMRTKVFARVLE